LLNTYTYTGYLPNSSKYSTSVAAPMLPYTHIDNNNNIYIYMGDYGTPKKINLNNGTVESYNYDIPTAMNAETGLIMYASYWWNKGQPVKIFTNNTLTVAYELPLPYIIPAKNNSYNTNGQLWINSIDTQNNIINGQYIYGGFRITPYENTTYENKDHILVPIVANTDYLLSIYSID